MDLSRIYLAVPEDPMGETDCSTYSKIINIIIVNARNIFFTLHEDMGKSLLA